MYLLLDRTEELRSAYLDARDHVVTRFWWFATDDAGDLALFDNACEGWVPDVFFTLTPEAYLIGQLALDELPRNPNYLGFTPTGVFHYELKDVPDFQDSDTYIRLEKITPAARRKWLSLAPEIQAIVGHIRYKGRFSDSMEVSANDFV